MTIETKKLIVAAAAFLAADSAFPSDWRFVMSSDSFDLLADASSMAPAPLVKVWVRFDGKPPYKVEDGQLQVRAMERWTIDCPSRRIATSDYTGYGPEGDAVVRKPGSATQFHDIAPDSVWDAAALKLCDPEIWE